MTTKSLLSGFGRALRKLWEKHLEVTALILCFVGIVVELAGLHGRVFTHRTLAVTDLVTESRPMLFLELIQVAYTASDPEFCRSGGKICKLIEFPRHRLIGKQNLSLRWKSLYSFRNEGRKSAFGYAPHHHDFLEISGSGDEGVNLQSRSVPEILNGEMRLNPNWWRKLNVIYRDGIAGSGRINADPWPIGVSGLSVHFLPLEITNGCRDAANYQCEKRYGSRYPIWWVCMLIASVGIMSAGVELVFRFRYRWIGGMGTALCVLGWISFVIALINVVSHVAF